MANLYCQSNHRENGNKIESVITWGNRLEAGSLMDQYILLDNDTTHNEMRPSPTPSWTFMVFYRLGPDWSYSLAGGSIALRQIALMKGTIPCAIRHVPRRASDRTPSPTSSTSCPPQWLSKWSQAGLKGGSLPAAALGQMDLQKHIASGS